LTLIEETFLKQIEDVLTERKAIKIKITQLKMEAFNAESDLIACNLKHERLIEGLRVHKATSVDRSLSPKDIELNRFRGVLPELLKKI
jgi:hypothetical protein